MENYSTVLILDYGSQYTQLIARRVRDLGLYSVVLSAESSIKKIQDVKPKAVILSGGPASVYDVRAPQLPQGFFDYLGKNRVSVLGICYGMQLLAKDLGGKVIPSDTREYGPMEIEDSSSGEKLNVWMSHGDEVKEVPPGFEVRWKSRSQKIAGFENPRSKTLGYQFHPEVSHTEKGVEFIKYFLFNLSGLQSDWKLESILEEKIQKIRLQVPAKSPVICALSGGVDSTVAAVMAHKALGSQLHCVFVDHGLLRYQEKEKVMQMVQEKLALPVTCIDSSQRFLEGLKNVVDPEEKRKIIGELFIRVFEDFASNAKVMAHFSQAGSQRPIAEKPQSSQGTHLSKPAQSSQGGQLSQPSQSSLVSPQSESFPEFLVQGTLYPDVIESSVGHQTAAVIKSHHNVGGLPEKMGFQLIEPLRNLFKDEVRRLGELLGIPREFLVRHPFPGPGLAIRIMGELSPERLEMLRKADDIFIQELYKYDLYDAVWQAFCVFLPVQTVGVQGDGRTHDFVISLRAVSSQDGMTADWYPFDSKFLSQVSTRICNEVRGINRVVYDITSKPPATIEWE